MVNFKFFSKICWKHDTSLQLLGIHYSSALTLPCYHFLFARYLGLTKCHFSSDILVPFPDLRDLYSQGPYPFCQCKTSISLLWCFSWVILNEWTHFFEYNEIQCFILINKYNKNFITILRDDANSNLGDYWKQPIDPLFDGLHASKNVSIRPSTYHKTWWSTY